VMIIGTNGKTQQEGGCPRGQVGQKKAEGGAASEKSGGQTTSGSGAKFTKKKGKWKLVIVRGGKENGPGISLTMSTKGEVKKQPARRSVSQDGGN